MRTKVASEVDPDGWQEVKKGRVHIGHVKKVGPGWRGRSLSRVEYINLPSAKVAADVLANLPGDPPPKKQFPDGWQKVRDLGYIRKNEHLWRCCRGEGSPEFLGFGSRRDAVRHLKAK